VVAGDAMVRSWGVGATMFPVAVGGGGGKGKASEWSFCNLVHVVLDNRFPCCLEVHLAHVVFFVIFCTIAHNSYCIA
jgi:hypothetical protein